MILTSDSIVSK